MSKTLIQKGLALTSAFALAVTGMVSIAAPASAAGEVISIAPTSGTAWASFDDDSYSIDVDIDADVFASAVYAERTAIRIDNADSVDVKITLTDGMQTTPDPDEVDYMLYNTETEDFISGLQTAVLTSGAYTIDFTDGATEYTTAIIDLTGVAGDFKMTVLATSGDTDAVALKVSAFLDDENLPQVEEFSTTGDKYPSTVETLTFYDPSTVSTIARIERFVSDASPNVFHQNRAGGNMSASLAFAPTLNLDQVDLSKFTFFSGATAVAATADLLAGSPKADATGKIYLTTDLTLAVDTSYNLQVIRALAAAEGVFSPGFTVPKQESTTTNLTAWDGVTADLTADSELNATTFALRSGVKTFVYTATATTKKANVPMAAVVTASDLATGGKLTVGSKVLTEGQAHVITGVSNANGAFSVSVSSDLAKSGEDYTVAFYYLTTTGTWVSTGAAVSAVYETASPETLDAQAEILAGASVTASFTVEDQFGKAISTTTSGTALVVEVDAAAGSLKQNAAVTNGAASLTFANYLVKGGNDTLVARVGTVSGSTFTALPGILALNLSLYNPEDASAIQVLATVSGSVTYDAFITGAESATNEAPALADDITYAGTVVDAAGAGIAGAVVTVKGTGLQFTDSLNATGVYFKDSITVAANETGSFELSVWSHQVSSAGVTITVTAGGKTATSLLKTTANANIEADDLKFSWNAPFHPAVDSTYIVTASVTDAWGNPISGADISFEADGALEVNGSSNVTLRTTNSSGTARVYVRSLLKTDGVGSVRAELTEVTVGATVLNNELSLGETFEPVLERDVIVGTDAIVSAGAKSGVIRVNAWNAKGDTVRVYVGGVLRRTVVSDQRNELVKVTGVNSGDRVVRVTIDGKRYFKNVVSVK